MFHGWVQAADWELINTTFLKPGRLFLFHGVSGGVLFNGLTMMFEILILLLMINASKPSS